MHCPELSAWEYENQHEEEKLEAPNNLIMMRKDIYDLFQDHAFGIDLDVSTLYCFGIYRRID